jgi:hypothetical protein
MLVAVALVVLMMTLFATIFQLATGAMARQKGLTENDQRVRLVATLLRSDLAGTDLDPATATRIKAHRTFKVLIPYNAAQTATGEITAPINPWDPLKQQAAVLDRAGYFYISENNPNDDTDDALQLTIAVRPASNDRLFGRAAVLLADGGGNFGPVGPPPPTPPSWIPPPPAPQVPTVINPYPPAGPAPAQLVLAPQQGYYFPNQPEFDDLLGVPNQVGSSTNAEVCYFLRNGTLYRRMMLVRLPNIQPSPVGDQGPLDDAGKALPFTGATSPYGGAGPNLRNFWTDFDYSGFYDLTKTPPGLTFHGTGDMSDSAGAGIPVIGNPSLVWPQTRWGFDNTTNATGATPTFGGGYGIPREYDSSGNYIGRFTHAETSDASFGYPALIPANGNPMANATPINLVNGAVSQFPNGTRAGEDILMSNVLAFDIKVWDPAASLGPDNAPGIAGFDDDGINGADDYGELGAYGSDDGDWRDLGHAGFTPNPLNAALLPASPPNPPGYGQPPYGFYCANAAKNSYYRNNYPTGTAPTGNRYDTWGPYVNIDGDTVYVGTDPPPYLPIYAGPDGKPGFAGTSALAATSLGTPGSDDFAPLTAIKITIRFYDVTSNQVRDLSGVYRLKWEQ